VEGKPFGRYRLVELLGRGGMGEVWRAHDTAIDRAVALKMLLPHYAQDRTFNQRFRREARAAARLDDPHVVPIYDVGEEDGRLYVTMRLITGRDLQALIDDGPLEPKRAVQIIEQVAAALNAAHRAELVHRDIKPSNILITDNDFTYLIDFGIARAIGETGLTSTGFTVGTWSYMAPERFRDGEVGPSSDIYALGCVLYQCLTGRLPFPSTTFEQVAMAHILTPPPKPSTQRRGIPGAMDEVIATGLAKDSDRRYQTATELATAAHQALTEAPRHHKTATVNIGPDSGGVRRTAPARPADSGNGAGSDAAPAQKAVAGRPTPQTKANRRAKPRSATGPPPRPAKVPARQRPRHTSIGLSRLALVLLLIGAIIVATGVVIGRHFSPHASAPGPTPSATRTGVVSPGTPPANTPTSSGSNELTALAADFAQLQNQLHAEIGIAITAVGSGASPSTLGDWQTGPAWSTIDVPLAIAALRQENPPQVTAAMKAAITESDTAAAESIWESLGDPITAARKVEDVLKEAGDVTTVQSQKVRPEFTAFGQTDWPLIEQARFLAFAVCDNQNEPIFSLMGQVEAGQRWGMGTIPDAQIKGGWGPSPSGSYLVRQIGILSTSTGMIAVAMAAAPASGSFADGTHDLTEVANWLTAHIAALPAGHCGS
jgi:serine/threonine protein kinase